MLIQFFVAEYQLLTAYSPFENASFKCGECSFVVFRKFTNMTHTRKVIDLTHFDICMKEKKTYLPMKNPVSLGLLLSSMYWAIIGALGAFPRP